MHSAEKIDFELKYLKSIPQKRICFLEYFGLSPGWSSYPDTEVTPVLSVLSWHS